MNTQRIEFRIGLMAITAFAVLVVMTLQFSKSSLLNFGSEYRIRVRFESAAGVTVGVPVFKSGVEVGRVSGVKLVENDCAVEVTAMIRSDRIIYKSEECRLKPAMLMGKTSLEFVRVNTSDDPTSDEAIPNDGTAMLRGVVPTDIFNSFSSLEGDLSQAIVQVSRAAENLASFLGNMNTFLGDSAAMEQKQKMVTDLLTETTDTIHDLRVLVHNTNLIVGDPNISQNLRQVTQEIPAVVKKLDETMTGAQSLVTEVRQVVSNVAPIIDSVRDDIPAITGSVKKSAAKLENVFDEVAMLVEAVNKANGTIKQLINDPTLYNNISSTVQNVERITNDLQPIIRDVKPITHNARVLTDKLARNPGVIISGALRKDPPLKGGLPSWGDSLGSDCLTSECFDDAVIRAYPELAMIGQTNSQEKKKSCLSLFASNSGSSNRGKSEAHRFVLPPMMLDEETCDDCATTPLAPQPQHVPQHVLPPISLTPAAPIPAIPESAPPSASVPRVIQTAEYRIPQSIVPVAYTQQMP